MGDKSKIEWTDATWNPIRGCSRVSEGCRNCYAERVAARFSGKGQPYEGLIGHYFEESRWNGKVRFIEDKLNEPLRWKKPRRIFVNSMSDLFHEKVNDEWIAAIFAVMALTPRHTYQVLTKRPQQMAGWFSRVGADPGNTLTELALQVEEGPWGEEFDATLDNYINGWSGFREKPDGNPMNGTVKRWPLPNVWLGVSVEDQKTADERIPLLLQTPAAVRWVSYEPALGSVDFSKIEITERLRDTVRKYAEHFGEDPDQAEKDCNFQPGLAYRNVLTGEWFDGWDGGKDRRKLNWVVCGGESGPGARPMHPEWALSVLRQCQAAGVPFFFKQWGEWRVQAGYSKTQIDCGIGFQRVGKKRAGRLLDGREWNEYPETKR